MYIYLDLGAPTRNGCWCVHLSKHLCAFVRAQRVCNYVRCPCRDIPMCSFTEINFLTVNITWWLSVASCVQLRTFKMYDVTHASRPIDPMRSTAWRPLLPFLFSHQKKKIKSNQIKKKKYQKKVTNCLIRSSQNMNCWILESANHGVCVKVIISSTNKYNICT